RHKTVVWILVALFSIARKKHGADFPLIYSKCNAVCANSPYFIEPPVATALTPSITLICLRLRVRPGRGGICTNSRNPCCRQLATNLHEVLLLINSTCTPLSSNVLLDGVRRDYAIATLNGSPTSTMTVPGLQLRLNTTDGRNLCFTASPPCANSTFALTESPGASCW
ncbi:hypothetical protein QJQ45_022948, partial [Haematococcus lacustris]